MSVEEEQEETVSYAENLRSEVKTEITTRPKSKAHRVEYEKILNGDPVEINPSVGSGYKRAHNMHLSALCTQAMVLNCVRSICRIMTVEEWASLFKSNEEFPTCLACRSTNTKEFWFLQQCMLIHNQTRPLSQHWIASKTEVIPWPSLTPSPLRRVSDAQALGERAGVSLLLPFLQPMVCRSRLQGSCSAIEQAV